ncbi:hypothetical protein Tco_0795800 [Tanacetum coccineum]
MVDPINKYRGTVVPEMHGCRDDIEALQQSCSTNMAMCHELVPTEKKKIERYIRGFPERIKGNIISSKPATLHEAINMARERGPTLQHSG